MTLFDLTPYGGEQTAKEHRAELRSAPERSSEPPIEQLAPGWRLVRNRRGVLPYAHLIKAVTSENGVFTQCNVWGTTLPRFDDDQGRRCPLCDMEAQLH